MARSLGMLTLAMLATLAVVGVIAHARYGTDGIVAASVGAVICWVAGAVALSMLTILRGPKLALHALLAGMIFRLGLPLIAGTVLQKQNGSLAKAGVFGWIMVFYLVMLVVETTSSLKLVQQARRETQA